MSAKRQAQGPVGAPPAGCGVGASPPRLEAPEKATGAAIYTDDMALPGMAQGAVLLSPHASALILDIDVEAARAIPGVLAVVTGEDCPAHLHGLLIKDEPVLARDRVRYAGEPVALVAAEDLETARAAVAAIEVRYQPLTPVLSIEAALADGAPALHEDFESYVQIVDTSLRTRPNELCVATMEHGDVEAAFAASDRIVESVFETPAQYHAYLEPAAAIARLEPGGGLTIWSAVQSLPRMQSILQEALGVPMAKVRVLAPEIGGGFGGKSEAQTQIFAALLAQACRRPVKLTLARDEDMAAMRTRHPARIRLRSGVSKEGTLLAREVEAFLDGGAYADDSPVILNVVLHFATGPYRIEAVRGRGTALYTNKMRAGAMRGFGNPQITFAVEAHMDEIAGTLGLDPLELRRRNLIAAGDRWVSGQPIRSSGLEACLEAATARSGWQARPRGGWTGPDGRRHGLGLALVCHSSAFGATSAEMRLLEDGSVTLNTGSVDIGQGGRTTMAQMGAEALGLDLGLIQLGEADSRSAPYNSGTNASRSTHMVGRAIGAAAQNLLSQIKARAALMLGAEADALEVRPGGVVALSGANVSVSFSDVALFAVNAPVGGGPVLASAAVMQNDPVDGAYTKTQGMLDLSSVGAYAFGAQAVEVAVDTETGKVEVVEAWCAHDVGRANNPVAVEGQIQGGFAQGLGFALTEDMVWEDGRLLTADFGSYKIPSSMEVPANIHALIVEEPDPDHPFGAKGVGEPPLIAAAPAILNAVADATGTHFSHLPLTPERVLAVLDAAAD